MDRKLSEADEVALVMRESMERARSLVREASCAFSQAGNRKTSAPTPASGRIADQSNRAE